MDTAQIGDIFAASWGYDQTNIDFYQVIRRTKKMVEVRKIRADHSDAGYSMASVLTPKKDHFLDSDHPYDKAYGSPFKRRLSKSYDGEEYFKVDSSSFARAWDGKPRTETYTG